jgi:hypothetical protein
MNKQIINITLEKNGMDILLKLKVAEEVEAFFKNASNGNTEQSNYWLDEENNGVIFYLKSEKVAHKVPSIEVIDNFGSELIREGKINVALLRSVGASQGVTIKCNDLLGYEEMKVYIEQLALWTRSFYETTMRPAQISAQIAFDV